MTVTLSAKPSTTPNWNTGGANRTTPSGAKQILGWAVGESPSSAFFNWWMNLEYQWQQWNEDAIDALNAGKADLDGDTFTGPMIFDGTVTLNDNVEIGGGVIINQSNGSTWFGDFVPESDLTYDLGTSSSRFAEVHSSKVIPYASDLDPVSDEEMISLNQNTAVIAQVRQTSLTSTAAWTTKHFNVNTATSSRTALGRYQINFDRSVSPDAIVIATCENTGNVVACATMHSSGAYCTVACRLADTGGDVDNSFSLLVIGPPASYL